MINPGFTIPILGQGHVRYLDHLGNDARICEAARTSYQSMPFSVDPFADRKLLRYLFIHRHTSPFEQCNISFEINMPIFCMRQFVRHRMFRLNEWSGRYTELPDKNYSPLVWRRQLPPGKNKQGSVKDFDSQWNLSATAVMQVAYRAAREAYERLLEQGVAKELARIVLPLATFTQIHVNCDLHNLMHFLWLRTDEHAQLELQEIGLAMLQITTELYPDTMALFKEFTPTMQERQTPLSDEVWVTQ